MEAVSALARPRVWTVFTAFGLAVVLTILAQVIVAVIVLTVHTSRGEPLQDVASRLPQLLTDLPNFLALIWSAQACFAAVALLGGWLSPVRLPMRLGLRRPESWSVYPVTMLGSIPVLAISLALAYVLSLVLAPDESLNKLFDDMTPAGAIPFLLTIALGPGFCEELFFRGYVQTRLIERWGAAWGIAVASLLFTIAHVMPHNMLAAAPLGVWIGIIAWRTGSILPGIACHAFVNGGLNAWRLAIKFGELSPTTQWAVQLTAVVIGSVAFVMACRQLSAPVPTHTQVTGERVTSTLCPTEIVSTDSAESSTASQN